MICKTFEVRDVGTFMPVLAIQLSPASEEDRWLLSRAGYGRTPEAQALYVLLHPLCYSECSYDQYFWTKNGARTLYVAHEYIHEHFAELESGAVIDVEYILGLSKAPKQSERLDEYGV